MSLIGVEIKKLEEEMRATEGWRIRSKLEIFSISIYTLQKNHEEIIRLLNQYETDTNLAFKLSSVNNREDFVAFSSEVARLLHNYLASAMTLVDHTRNLFKAEYKDTQFEKEYDNKKEQSFVQSPVSGFVKDLRNYSLHKMLPITGATLDYDESGMSHSIFMPKDKLIDWDGWKSKAKEYLNTQGKKIVLLQLINEYTKIVFEFQAWFQEKQNEIHSDSMKELEKLELEYSAKVKQAFPN
ncbi:hypothetical protein [Bacillus cereus]|uniref:hypothetical protein n=1 Tax=Bacillus cereus group TaxID=86661 RepID=UPI00240558BD|nr:hypothetical protein [Bacillus cereus]MDF9530611.1 hypothetical protein [Bacillus cereus]MDG1578885.1 hypothetical protein [Bacillus cereus]